MTDEFDVRGIGADRIEFTGGWNITVAVMEFVREDPLEGELRRRIAAALPSVDGVESAGEMDTEVWFVTGSPSGEAMVRAVAAVVDALALTLRGNELPRPETYQFTAALLTAANGQLREIRISHLTDGIFYAQAVLSTGATIDARPVTPSTSRQSATCPSTRQPNSSTASPLAPPMSDPRSPPSAMTLAPSRGQNDHAPPN